MGKLKKKISNIRSAFSVKTHKMPRLAIIAMMLFLNIVILLIAALIALIIDDAFNSYLEALALGSVTWLLAPNAILEIDNPQTLFLAVSVLLIGIILFSGTIIALITNALKDYFEKKQSSSGKIYMQDHIVILNYNNKVPELIADLLYVKSRQISVLILADVDRRVVEEKIRNALLNQNVSKDKIKKFNVLIKKGSPLNQGELLDCSIDKSNTIIIMNDHVFDLEGEGLTVGDLNVIKILLGLGQLSLRQDVNIVSEVKAFETKEKVLALKKQIKSLKQYHLIPICFDKRLGQIMAQTIIQKYTEDIYLSMFSFEGSEVYPVEETSFDECLNYATHAIPLGDYEGQLYALSGTYLEAQKFDQSSNVQLETLTLKDLKEKTHLNVLIVGSNNKKSYIEESFKAYETLHRSEFSIKNIAHNALKDYIHAIDQSVPLTIILLSDETKSDDRLDGEVIDSLIYLKKVIHDKNVHIIVELLDPKNDRLIKDLDIDNTIISNKIISLLLSKLALFPRTEAFYDDLLSIASNEEKNDTKALHVQKANTLYDANFPIPFNSIKTFVNTHFASANHKTIPLGTIKNDKVKLFSGDLMKKTISIEASDDIILYKL